MKALGVYKKPFIIALSMHVLLIAALLFSPTTSVPDANPVLSEPAEIVKAVAVNQQQVEQEMKKIKDEKAQKQRAEELRVKKLQQQAEEAKQKREQELAQATKMKAEQKRLEQELALKQKLATETLAKQQKEAAAELAQQKALAEKARAEALKQQEAAKNIEHQAAAQAQAQQAASVRQSRLQTELAKIRQAIADQWRVPDVGQQEISTTLMIRLAPDGTVLKADIVKSSGDDVLDRSAQTAVFKASPLPVPSDPELFDLLRSIRLTVKPNGDLITG